MSFIDELKRRKVFRVAASYAVVAFIIMQLVEILFPMFDFPQWTQQFIVIVILLGFPIAVILSWVFDKTPQGYIKTDAENTTQIGEMTVKIHNRPFYAKKRNIFLALGVIAGILIGTYGGDTFKKSVDDKSIAVLPFDNFSKNEDDEFFTAGITEDITMNLAKIKDLTVISRTSVMGYKGTTKKMKQIAKELGVKYILEGSVRKIGDRVRIVGQLIDANNDKHVWSDSYDREMADLFQIQADVSKKIATAMEAELSDKTLTQIETIPTNNMDAYILYQRARSYYGMYTNDGNETAINLFNEALSIDKNYALAYAGLSDCYGQRLIRFSYSKDWADSALHTADIALKINPNLAEAHKAKGLAYLGLNMNEKSEVHTDKALELNPGFHTAIANKGIALTRRGMLYDAYNYFTKSIRLNPTSTSTEYTNLSEIYLIIDEDELSDEYLFKAIKNSPNVVSTYRRGIPIMLIRKKSEQAKDIQNLFATNIANKDDIIIFNGLTSYYNKDYKTALNFFNSVKKSTMMTWTSSAFSAHSNKYFLVKTLYHLKLSYNDLLDEGIDYYESLLINGADLNNIYFQLSALYSIKNDTNQSLEYLEKAIERGFRNKIVLVDSAFDSIRNRDRFKLAVSEIDIFIQREKIKFKQAGLIPSI